MRTIAVSIVTLAAGLAAAPAALAQNAETGAMRAGPLAWESLPEGVSLYEAPILGPEGTEIGLLLLVGGENGVVGRFAIDPGVLAPGWHGVHLHAVGDCSDAPAFQASGGHVTAEGAMHGYLHPQGPEAGDLASFFAQEDGSAVASFATSLVTFEGDTPLFDEDGSALVVHAMWDDQHTQPIGGSGDRMACAVIDEE